MALKAIDVNSRPQIPQNSDPDKPLPRSEKKATSKAIFDGVCASRVGELIDGDDESLTEWSFDDFTFVRELGKGGSASVYLAREKKSGYEVALKVQHDQENAMCELDIHQHLDHPNIVNIIDYFLSDAKFGDQKQEEEEGKGDEDFSSASCTGSLVMILEVCDSGSLFDVIRDSKSGYLEEKLAAKYLWGAIKALEYIHKQDIIHCDIKSLNFLVHAQTLKICDFGMSVRNDEREIVGGSPVYMSPEHLMSWRHFDDKFDHCVDIYSLGVILFEMLVGYLPYEVLDHKDEDDSLLAGFDKLRLKEDKENDAFKLPILDIRKLDDCNDKEPFYIPPPIFPDFVSPEAQDLIYSLMEPSIENRISLTDAKKHPWVLKHITPS